MSVDIARVMEWMDSNGLTVESRLYRYTLPEHLEPTGDGGYWEITANSDPSEAVIDVYGQGHSALAVHVGAGLAFAESVDNAWRSDGRRCVELQLGDVLGQGGVVYPVESITTEPVWYVTIPTGKVRVRLVEA